ncbi:WD40 repeat domain-containing protein [Paenibacillus nasutitermitis]|uniref:Uncharacterized protein n=1 Tax=Paenibacillus nasutitermitis TaxID=1652958 RepID=A0A916YMB1_9BACL|nr:WD40 repeat domain-containing protein [Paenibacillus nasutitermitis]GGD52450.1 hypothetical protein GCM10010911_07500 [Paenibacillus nasutitermitis]
MPAIGSQMQYERLEEPCRNFNILGSTTIVDPKDGREKIVLSNFAAGAVGNVILMDSMTGEGESIQLPGDHGAWAILNVNNEKLLIGTCSKFGYLHSLDLKSRTWAEPLRDENESYIWNLTLGSDGMVYGGTYPGCSLLRYNPQKHTLENLGRMSDNPKNIYSRYVYGDVPGYILISGGFDAPFLASWNIETHRLKQFASLDTVGVVQQITSEYICVGSGKDNEKLSFWDPNSFAPLDDSTFKDKRMASKGLMLKDDRLLRVRGQDYYTFENEEDQPDYKRIPTSAPATEIHTITSDAEGTIWGACGFGQTIFYYKPEDKSYWNSSQITSSGGEVYGMSFHQNKLYMSAYAGGDHIVYDPSKPWDELNNVNPKTLNSVSPQLIRPTGRTVVGPDGGVWTGWSAKYGKYGGGLSRIDPSTEEVLSWYDPIANQQIAGLSADDTFIYFTTNGGASGLTYNQDVRCHFVVWSPEGRIVHKQPFPKDIVLRNVIAAGGRVLVNAGEHIQIFDPSQMAFVKNITIGEACSCMLETDHGYVLAFCKNHVYRIHCITGEFEPISDLPGSVGTAAITPDGTVYFAHATVLYRLVQAAETEKAGKLN